MLSQHIFSETSPASAITAVSSQPVAGAASYLANGIAGPLDDLLELRIIAELVGATGGTLDVVVQTSFDEGGTWYEYCRFPQLSAGASAIVYSATSANSPAGIVAVSKSTTLVLPQNTIVGGAWGNRARLVMVAGSGTSAGAAVKVGIYGQRPWRNVG